MSKAIFRSLHPNRWFFSILLSTASLASPSAMAANSSSSTIESQPSINVGDIHTSETHVAEATYFDGLCVDFRSPRNSVASVNFNKDRDGRLYWSFRLSSNAQSYLGSPVTVYMPSASVNNYQGYFILNTRLRVSNPNWQ